MRIERTISSIISQLKPEFINNHDMYFLLFFYNKKTKDVTHIPTSILRGYTYVDDIAHVGVSGSLRMVNTAGAFDSILNETDNYYIGFYAKDNLCNYEENIWFSIAQSSPIPEEATSAGVLYDIRLVEAFMNEGAQRSVSAYAAAAGNSGWSAFFNTVKTDTEKLGVKENVIEGDSVSGRSLADLLEFGTSLIHTNLNVQQLGSGAKNVTKDNLFLNEAKNGKIILDLDKDAIKHYNNTHPSSLMGDMIYKNLTTKETVADMFNLVLKYCYSPIGAAGTSYQPSAVNLEVGVPATARSENISKIVVPRSVYPSKPTLGERKLTIRSLKDTFSECFQNNHLYEMFVSTKGIDKKKTSKQTRYVYKGPISNAVFLPTPMVLSNTEWSNYIIRPLNQTDGFNAVYYTMPDAIEHFKSEYLHNQCTPNLAKETFETKGIISKQPPYDDNTLAYAVSGGTIRSMFTINGMTQFTLVGQLYRKANEIVYIDKDIISYEKVSDNGTQITLGNTVANNYYYVTRVIHSFTGSEYKNSLYLCGFADEKLS